MVFQKLEDYLQSMDVEEQKHNHMRDTEAAGGVANAGDLYSLYPTTPVTCQHLQGAPLDAGYGDAFAKSSQALPLIENASPFQHADLYKDEYDDRKSFCSEDYDGHSQFTSVHDVVNSNFGTESYVPSRNMFQNANSKGLLDKEALVGEISGGETSEVLKESSACRRWVALCWILTLWVPNPLFAYLGRMKRLDVQQAWREKLALNILIWFVCGCAIFTIAVLGNIICLTEHVFSSELQSHSMTSSPNNVYTSIHGEVFSSEERQHLHLMDKTIYCYLGTGAMSG